MNRNSSLTGRTAVLLAAGIWLLCAGWSLPLPPEDGDIENAREKQGSNRELCAIKTVAVAGNSEAATKVRKEVEQRTWLKLVGSPEKADAVLDVAESRTEHGRRISVQKATVSATLTMRSSGEIVWSDSSTFDGDPLRSGASVAAKLVLSHLARQAGCK